MAKCKVVPRNDPFLAWFESLSLEAQEKVLRIADRIQQESFGGIISTELLADALLHVAPRYDPVIFLN